MWRRRRRSVPGHRLQVQCLLAVQEEDKTPKKPSSRTSKPKKQVKRELLPPAEIVETQEELADGIERGREDDEESLTVKNLKKVGPFLDPSAGPSSYLVGNPEGQIHERPSGCRQWGRDHGGS